jgi:cold-inducible RNA-binding protein
MTNIFIGGFEYAMTEANLRKLFEPFGPVEKVTIVRDHETRQSRGYGFVEMTNNNEAAAAMKALNGKSIGKRAVTVNEARKTPQRVSGSRDERERKPQR